MGTLTRDTSKQMAYVGHTDGGPPTAGSFVAGNWCDDGDEMWICVAPGTPGQWESLRDSGTSAQLSGDPYFSTLHVGGTDTAATPRNPFLTNMVLPAAAAGAEDFVAHVLTTEVTGDFTGIDSPNDGWLWGLNVYTATGPAAGDGKGLEWFFGGLIEAAVRSGNTAHITNVVGLSAEAAFVGASSDASLVDMMISLKVVGPKRKEGATTGVATTAVGLYVDQPGTVGATTSWALFVAGGNSYFGGNVHIGTVTLNDQGGDNLGIDATVVADNFYTAAGLAYATGFRYAPNSECMVVWGNGSPEGVTYAGVGSIYLRRDGGTTTTMYVKETNGSDPTGWVAK